MPRYDFICEQCGEITEVERIIDNRNRGPGPCKLLVGDAEVMCGGKTIRKWTPAIFRFAGGQPSHG